MKDRNRGKPVGIDEPTKSDEPQCRAASTQSGDKDDRAVQPGNAIYLSGNLPFSSAICANGYPRPLQEQQVQNMTISIHLIQPIESNDPEPMSRVYSTFRAFARNALISGTPSQQIIGSPDIEPDHILDSSKFVSSCMLTKWAFEVVGSFGEQMDLAVRIGSAQMIYKLMRV